MVDAKRLYEVKSATVRDFGDLWLANHEAIRSHIARSPRVTSLFDRFKGTPCVVVGAGPSLDKNMSLLQAARDRVFIICVDTIFSALHNAGVTPAITVTLDPQQGIAQMFADVDTAGGILVAPTIAHPRALEAWRGEIVFYNKYAPDIPQLVKISNANPDVGFLIPGGTVLSVGLDLAFRMGANPIAFIGQDLCYPPGMAAYSKNTTYGGADYTELFREKLDDMVTDTDIFGREAPTQKSMFITKQWMEWAFTTWKRDTPADFYNCTEGGIVSNHCHIVTFEEWLLRFTGEKKNFKWALQKALKRKKR